MGSSGTSAKKSGLGVFAMALLVLAGGVLYGKYRLDRHKDILRQQEIEFDKEQAALQERFGRQMESLQRSGVIASAKVYKDELNKYTSNSGTCNLFPLAEKVYKKNAKSGLLVFEALCSVFESNAEMTEWLDEEINTYLYKDTDRFISAAAALRENDFACISPQIELSWARTGASAELDIAYESRRLASKLRAGKHGDNPNVKKIILQLEK